MLNGNAVTIQAEFGLDCSPITLNLNVNNEINRILHYIMKRKTTALRQRHTTWFAQNSSTKSGHTICYECSFVVRCNYISVFLCDNIYFHPCLHSSTICLRSLLIVSKLVLVMQIELSINQSINQSHSTRIRYVFCIIISYHLINAANNISPLTVPPHHFSPSHSKLQNQRYSSDRSCILLSCK